MKSKLQDGDVCLVKEGIQLTVKNQWLFMGVTANLALTFYDEMLTRKDNLKSLDIIRVTRNGVIIWERTDPINKMMTVEVNGETYPLPTHENMKVLVDKISELELRIKILENAKS